MESYVHLVMLAKQNDAESFAKLYEQVYMDLYRFALYTLKNEQDAQDAVSDTVVDAYSSIHKLRDPMAFKGWIFKILSNKCKRILKQYVKKTVPLDDSLVDTQRNLVEEHDVRMAFSNLSGEERMILAMELFAGYNSSEIGQIMKLNSSTVRSKRRRALEKMRPGLE